MCQKKLVNKTSIFLGFPPISKMAKMAKMRLGGRKSCNSRFCLFISRKLWIFKFYINCAIVHQLKSSREISTKMKGLPILGQKLQKWPFSPHYLELRSTNIKDNFPLCALIYSISQNPSGHSRLWNFPRLISEVEACSNLKKTFDIYLQSERSELRIV